MGNSYANITLRTADQDAVLSSLRDHGRSAWVSAPLGGCIVVIDRGLTDAEDRLLERLSADLSGTLACAALAVLVHDDSTLLYLLHENGALRDRYVSSPYYFVSGLRALFGGPREDALPEGGNAEALREAFAPHTDTADIAAILQAPTLSRVLAMDGPDVQARVKAGRQISAETAKAITEAATRARFRFEHQRHQALVEALGLPAVAVATVYEDVANGDVDCAFAHT